MSWLVPESFREVRERYRQALKDAVFFYLEDAREAERVTAGALEQAERQWGALEGETNILQLLAQAAVDHCERLLPRMWGRPKRRVPTVEQLAGHLERFRFERRVEEMRLNLEVRRASARESNRTDEGAALARAESELEWLVTQFYNKRLRIDEDGFQEGGAACPVVSPPPRRDPGGGRTFLEALEPARNP